MTAAYGVYGVKLMNMGLMHWTLTRSGTDRLKNSFKLPQLYPTHLPQKELHFNPSQGHVVNLSVQILLLPLRAFGTSFRMV